MASNKLKHYLSGAATFGLEDYSVDDGEQELDVVVSSEPSVDQVIAEMTEAEIRQKEIEQDAASLAEATESLEAYMQLLESGLENGGISAQAAAFMRVGLERYEAMFGLSEPATPSVEAFGGSASQLRSTMVSIESVGEILKQSWEALKRALLAIWNAIKDVYQQATNGIVTLGKRARSLQQKARSLRGKGKEGGTLTIQNPDKLMAEGQWVGDNPALVLGFAAYALDTLPETVIKYVSDVAEKIKELDPATMTDPELLDLVEFDNISNKFPMAARPSNDRRFSPSADVVRTAVMPGNVALYLSKPGVLERNFLNRVSRLMSDMKIELLPVPNAHPAPAQYELTIKAPDALAEQCGMIVEAASKINKWNKHPKAIRDAIDQLVKAGDDFETRIGKAELTAEQSDKASAVLHSLVAVQRMVQSSVSGVLAYCVRTLNAQLAVIERQLAAHEEAAA